MKPNCLTFNLDLPKYSGDIVFLTFELGRWSRSTLQHIADLNFHERSPCQGVSWATLSTIRLNSSIYTEILIELHISWWDLQREHTNPFKTVEIAMKSTVNGFIVSWCWFVILKNVKSIQHSTVFLIDMHYTLQWLTIGLLWPASTPNGRLLSAWITSEGTDYFNGSLNLAPTHPLLRLRCQVDTTEPDPVLHYKWSRNGGFMGVNSQVHPNLFNVLSTGLFHTGNPYIIHIKLFFFSIFLYFFLLFLFFLFSYGVKNIKYGISLQINQ